MLTLTGLQKEIFLKRYAMNNETEWSECCDRVSSVVSQIEINGKRDECWERFYQAMIEGDFMPGGRILFGAGRNKFNMLNCYRLHSSDSVSSIAKMIADTYSISCGGGGIGFNFSDIRPKGDNIQDIKWSAPGAVSVMKMINEIGHHVRSGGSRRTALIAILNVTHPDILEFLEVKLNLNELTNFNISIGITNDFLEAVKKNKSWHFIFNGRTYKVYELTRNTKGELVKIKVPALNEEDAIGRAVNHYRISQDDIFSDIKEIDFKARDIWDTMVINSWKSGDPGIYNIDLANTHTNVSYFEDLSCSNPCGEINLPPYGNCCLGHVNLSNMYDENKKDVNWKRFAKTIRTGIRFLDNVLTINHYPIPECREVGERSRRIGLGIVGLHYLLIKLGYRYGDQKCLEFLDRLFATFRNEAYLASIELAKEKGSFPAFNFEKYSQESFFKQLPPRIQKSIKEFGIRNAVMLTIAPTGTTSMVLGVSSGIEPIFAPIYTRHFRDGNIWREEIVVDKLFAQYYNQGNSIDHFCGAYDIPVEEHLAVQATIQKYIDSAISKTTNLPNDYPVEKLSDVILNYAQYVKGFTIYRAGSKGTEPLEPIDISKVDIDALMKNTEIDVTSIDSCKNGVCEL